jgi:hypothetical protein
MDADARRVPEQGRERKRSLPEIKAGMVVWIYLWPVGRKMGFRFVCANAQQIVVFIACFLEENERLKLLDSVGFGHICREDPQKL